MLPNPMATNITMNSISIKTAIVILNWNGEHFLRQFLPNVLQHSLCNDVAVVVADNGSTDGSLALLDTQFPEVQQIRLYQNYGFAEGYNRALSQINATYYVLLNSDVEVAPNWLQPLTTFMDSHPKVAACAPKIIAHTNRQQFEYAGAAGGFIDRWGYPFCRGRILSNIEPDNGQYDTPLQTFWASGAALFIRAKAYAEAGGLDARFFAHMEEIDLCWRLNNHGYQVWNIPQSTVYHVGGGTLPNNNPRKLYLNYRNSLYMLHKNLNTSALWPILLFRMCLDGLSGLAYLFSGNPQNTAAVIRSHVDFWRNIGASQHFRTNTPKRPRRQISTIYHRSILIDFFLLKIRTFNRIKWRTPQH